MPNHETYSVTATLVPGAGTASLMRIVSILHSRGVHVTELTFTSGDVTAEGKLTARVSSGNAGREIVAASLRHAVDLLEVTTRTPVP